MKRIGIRGLLACVLPLCVCSRAAVLVDTSPGTGAPPGTLGGYAMGAFPADPTAEGTVITQLVPPVAANKTSNLLFASGVEHMLVGPAHLWDTWSHGYTGDVYFNADDDLLMWSLPQDTYAFSMYIQPNLKADYEFKVVSDATITTLTINGNGGAKYVGFYTDDMLYPLQYVYILQTTNDSDGFAAGEFMIDVVPEPGAWAGLTAMGLGLWALARRRLG